MIRNNFLILVAALMLGAQAASAQRVQAPFGPGGTWNVYELVPDVVTWEQAMAEAEAHQFQNVDGRLMDIHSAAENALAESYTTFTLWIGLTDREGAAPDVFQWGQWSPQESFNLPDPAHQGWAWTSGEPVSYVRWESTPQDRSSRRDAVYMFATGFWQDDTSGFLTDLPVTPVRQPGTSGDESGASKSAYMVEYPIQSPIPLPGVEIYRHTPRMPTQMPGIRGGQGTLGLSEYRGNDLVMERGIEVVQYLESISGADQKPRSFDAQLTKADVANLVTGGPVIKDPPLPFPSNAGGGAGDGRISVAQGSIYVPVAGKYTIQVHSADGFGLKIGDTPFTAAGRNGAIDGVDPEVLYYPRFTGDSDARGVIELSAGKHDFQFYSWGASFLAHWEITSAMGEYPRREDLQWKVIGDGSLSAETSRGAAPLVLVEPATVINVDSANGGDVTSSAGAEAAIRSALDNGTGLRRQDVTTVVLRDTVGIKFRPGLGLEPDETFLLPINDPQVGGSRLEANAFSTGVFGKFTIDDGDGVDGELQPITVSLHSDDRSQLRVIGADFLKVNGGTLEERPDGDVQLVSSKTLPNGNVSGLLQLQEGKEYSFEAFGYDRTLGSGLEIWAAWGEQLQSTTLDPMIAFPLSTNDQQRMMPVNVGFTFVADDFVPMRGDYNVNGVLDAGDLDIQSLAIKQADPSFDLNQDSQVDYADRLVWIHSIANTVVGDANFDRLFTTADLVAVFQAGRYETAQSALWSEGDFNGDFRFTTSDLVVSFQDGAYEAVRAQAIPEPAGWLVSMTGFLFVMGRRVVRRRAAC